MERPQPQISQLLETRLPSAVRAAMIEFARRKDGVEAINTSIGNVSLPIHPKMKERLFNLDAAGSPFVDGIIQYTATVGTPEAREAILNVIASSGLSIEGLFAHVTDGGSAAMELVILGICGEPGTGDRPLLTLDPAYSNYQSLAERTGRKTVAINRHLEEDGSFSLPDFAEIEAAILEHKPGALLVIPYDNPTGQFFTREMMAEFAKLCVKHNIWMVSDEAYRELAYDENQPVSSVWALTEDEVPGITGRRISIESASKVWNGCGLRIGWLVTDNQELHEKTVFEATATLCANAIAQYIVGALANLSHEELQAWYKKQREYYAPMMEELTENLKVSLPGVIVSEPSASLYSVIDVRNLVDDTFNAQDFVMWCASEGKTTVNGEELTLLVSPMAGFYQDTPGKENPGRTQMRVAYVEQPEKMALVPSLFAQLFTQYMSQRKAA